MRVAFLLPGLCLLLLAAPPVRAEFHALLVGINYREADPVIRRLNGALRDVDHVRAYLTQDLGLPDTSIRTLKEDQATRTAILDGLQAWLSATRPGDTLLFMYSGHGVAVPDPFGDQQHDPVKRPTQTTLDIWQREMPSRRVAEALVPHDTQVDAANKTLANLLLDSELHTLLRRLRDRRLLLWLDNCHASGVTKSLVANRLKIKQLDLPWQPADTRLAAPERARARGLDIARDSSWHPPYAYFAATTHQRKAYEWRGAGALTQAMLRLLRANPAADYSNRQVLEYARRTVRQTMQLPLQEPVFYGPAGALDARFPLLALRRAGGGDARPVPPEVISTRVKIRGEAAPCPELRRELSRQSGLIADAHDPEVILHCAAGQVTVYHAAGHRLQTLAPKLSEVLAALDRQAAAWQLAHLNNPALPFRVELWLEQPGKTRFPRDAEPVLYYRVKDLPTDKAYLTLFNLAPDGSLAILYPQPADFVAGRSAKWFVNAEVQPGVLHSIPKTRAALKPGQHAAIDLQLRLNQPGEEYFKAIVTAEPLAWAALDLGAFRAHFQSGEARRLATATARGLAGIARDNPVWATGELRVRVE